jgi:hypothetical protein
VTVSQVSGARALTGDVTGKEADVVVLPYGSTPSSQQVPQYGDLLPMSADSALHSCFRRLEDNTAALAFASVARSYLTGKGLVSPQQFDSPVSALMLMDDPTTPGVEILSITINAQAMSAAQINARSALPPSPVAALAFIDRSTMTVLDAGFTTW